MKPGVRADGWPRAGTRLGLRLAAWWVMRGQAKLKAALKVGLKLGLKGGLVVGLVLGLSACQSLPTRGQCPSGPNTRAPESADLLLGTWTVLLWGESPERLSLSPHPEHTGSWRGVLTQGPLRHAVVADWDDAEFTLEESHDGQRIAATWQGRRSEGGCGQHIVGHRHRPGHDAQEFLMMRTP